MNAAGKFRVNMIDELKKQGFAILSLSGGYIGVAILFSIGVILFDKYPVSCLLFIPGYELARKTFLFMVKDAGGKINGK